MQYAIRTNAVLIALIAVQKLIIGTIALFAQLFIVTPVMKNG